MPLQFDPDASCQITASMPDEFGHDGEHWAPDVTFPNLILGEAGSVYNLLNAGLVHLLELEVGLAASSISGGSAVGHARVGFIRHGCWTPTCRSRRRVSGARDRRASPPWRRTTPGAVVCRGCRPCEGGGARRGRSNRVSRTNRSRGGETASSVLCRAPMAVPRLGAALTAARGADGGSAPTIGVDRISFTVHPWGYRLIAAIRSETSGRIRRRKANGRVAWA